MFEDFTQTLVPQETPAAMPFQAKPFQAPATTYQAKPEYNKKPFFEKKEDLSEGVLYKPFVVTGNRDTPVTVLEVMHRLVQELEYFGFTLRTGGSEGADDVAEKASKTVELYLPWKPFNEKESKLYFNSKQSKDIAKMFHPGYDALKPAIQAFLARNVRMVLGDKLRSPVMLVICWSEDGAESVKEVTSKTGTVGHVISVASAMKIPVFNLSRPNAEPRLKQYLELKNG